MSYQLPPETKTSKLESLPEDARKLAEELIADKFGLGEVVDGGSRDTDFFGQGASVNPYPTNTIQGELVSRSGQRFRFITQLSPSMQWGTQDGQYRSSSASSQLLRYIEETVRRYVHKFENEYRDLIDEIILEMNGYRKIIRTSSDIEEFASRAYRQDSVRMNYHQNYWQTNTTGNWTYT